MDCSIIIPYYKKEKSLFLLLESLNRQTAGNFEVIVVNDGSDDIIEKLHERRFSFPMRYLCYPRTQSSGRPFARNRGIDAASGDILIFVDCDQIVDADFVRNHTAPFEGCDNEVLYFGTRRFLLEELAPGADPKSVPYIDDARHDVFRYFKGINQRIEAVWHLVFSHNMSVRRETVRKLGGFDESFKGWGLEDTEFAYRMARNGVEIKFLDNVEVFSVYEESKIDNTERFREWSANLDRFIKKYPEAPVLLQEQFVSYYDIEKRKLLFNQGIDNPWLFCFICFEYSVKLYLATRLDSI